MSSRKRSSNSITGGYKSTPFKMPARTTVVSSGRAPIWRSVGTLPSSSELKFTDVTAATATAVAALTFTTPGASFLLNGLVPNSTATGRIGRRIMMKSIYIRLVWSLAATTTGGSPLRMIVVYDKQSNGAAPAVTDVLLTDSAISPNNISNRDRFVVLCDKLVDPVAVGSQFQVADVVYKKLNLPVQYNAGTAGTIADITSGAVYIMFAQFGGAFTAAPVVSWTSRIRYNDS